MPPSRLPLRGRAGSCLAGALLCLAALALPGAAQETAPQTEGPGLTAPAPEVDTAPALPAAPQDTRPGTEPAPETQAAPVPAAPAVAAQGQAAPERTLPHELSPWGMFIEADWVVKAVMIGLAFACFVTWTVLMFKLVEIAAARARARRALDVVREAKTLAAAVAGLGARTDPASFMVRAAEEEFRRSAAALDAAGPEGVKERTRSILARTEAQAGRRLARGTGLLATIGATAPFVGLFGTVWGIMNAFIGISKSQTTNLAVVAPGIAEALLATAIGLVAAIPAVVIYNAFARAIAGYRQMLGDAGAGVERLLSRDLDFRRAGTEG